MNKIKTTKTIILAAFVVVGGLLTSCSNDDDNQEASIVGAWKSISAIEETFVGNVRESMKEITVDDKNFEILTFTSNGNLTIFEESKNESLSELATYTVKGKTIFISHEGETEVEEVGSTLNENELILEYTEEDETNRYLLTVMYKRQ
ncbi:hypothetical protein LX77_03342 [Gelidibacter algens]|uniref:Lipocalin-like domain-containing protein n=1 Tax=Gelidibacter algens TaxID=49280 RepID=A0A1A7R0B9_9FLAO|nr:lipocalin family protein [Gelidibacter algens]OBX24973.1 hypothetical protein A9996_12285 [Gelidibacter algens]RAJ19822.1 hypothetical protein LX77_03342 [Gelidibacter algens]